MGDDDGRYAEIVPLPGDLSNVGYRGMGPMPRRQAEWTCRGTDVDHGKYSTGTRPVDGPTPEGATGASPRP